ncbi:MAG: helix-hairpin-helix domain-containing protein [Pirellulales bacterium]
MTNAQIASVLDEIALLRQLRGESPFRVSAYRNAAITLRRMKPSVAALYAREGLAGLRELPGVGTSLSRRIGEIVRTGHSRLLDRLQEKQQQPTELLTTLPNVGPRLAGRIQATLGTSSLEELLRAAHDGRLRRVQGVGRKRVQAIRESLAARLNAARTAPVETSVLGEPPVAELLEIDRQYRRQAARGSLLRVAPKKFNPAGVAWLPIWRTQHNGRRYLVHFTNSARSHQLGLVYDWVAVFREDKNAFGQWTVITATHGPLQGRRVVRGREHECELFYADSRRVQLKLPQLDGH